MSTWPELHYDDWKDTLATLQLWTQIVGKIRLKQEPLVNHWWNVTLYPTARGLTTSAMPYESRSFEILFDFVEHELRIDDSDGRRTAFPLEPMSVAEFYARVMTSLDELGIKIAINTKPNEVTEAIPLDEDTVHQSYDREYAQRFWRVLLQISRLSEIFRAGFLGKASRAHFFWGSFDLAQSLFSGRPAPPHPGGFPNLPDWVTREAYSREVFSVGFWPGGFGLDAMLYAYIYPIPPGLAEAAIRPETAAWNEQLREFVLPYEAARTATDPDRCVLDFFQSAYATAADCAGWDRAALDRIS
jgi:hypothetical protein